MKGGLKASSNLLGYDEESVKQTLTKKLEQMEREKSAIVAVETEVLQTKVMSTLVLKMIKGQIEDAEARKTLLKKNWVNPEQFIDYHRDKAQDKARSILKEANEYARARENEVAVVIQKIAELEEQMAVLKQETSGIDLQQYDIPTVKTVSAGGTIPIKRHGDSVFIVEDNGLVERMLTSLLVREGFTTFVAKDGRQAMLLIDEIVPPSVVLLDIMLPYISGLQLLKHIRSKREWDRTAVIMVTGNTKTSDIRYALKSGANEYVKKPFDPIVLVKIIKDSIRQLAEK